MSEVIVTDTVVYLINVEIFEFCQLNLLTGEKIFFQKDKSKKRVAGQYYKDEKTFFALIFINDNRVMYFDNKIYKLDKDLHISVEKNGEWRKFTVLEYNINILYHTSKYIGFDVWSTEEDVDLFYQISRQYKNDNYYKKYIK